MREYSLDSKYLLVGTDASPKGAQKKYRKDGYYYKVDMNGAEGFTEYVVSLVLENSSLPKDAYVRYEHCIINGREGCRSKDFLKQGDMFLTMEAIYERLTGGCGIADFIFSLSSAVERLQYILQLVEQLGLDVSLYREYMNIMLQLDMLILNKDRHAQNYGLVYNRMSGTYRISPLFDNGFSLDTDRRGDNASCTISGSYTEQVLVFGFPVKAAFTINYEKLKSDIAAIEGLYGSRYELQVLRKQLDIYESLFKQ